MQALSHKNSDFNIKEPFQGLFTQGMVCHETYKDENNNWLSPDEVITIDGKKYKKSNAKKEIIIGPSESMSKSKKNTIDPEKIISNYGADSVRLFILSDSPPEKDVQWSEEGIVSSYKFIQKLWNLNLKILNEIKKDHPKNNDDEIEKFSNKFIKKISHYLENFNYNIVVANFYEMYSFFNKAIDKPYKKNTLKNNYLKILISMSPLIPHFASESLELFSEKTENVWPSYDEKFIKDDFIMYVVQINGKKRALINSKNGITEEELIKDIMTNKDLTKYLEGQKIKKKVFVPNRLINFII